MNDEHIEKMLASVNEDFSAPKHRTALRSALMREHARTRRPYFALRLSRYLSMKTAMIPVSAIAVLVLVAAGTFGVTQKSAEAQELAERAMARVVQIPPEMRAQIEAQMKSDMMQALEEAYRAPDLRILTREQYEKEAQFTFATGTPRFAAGTVHAVASRAGAAPLGSPETISFRAVDSRDVHYETASAGVSEPAVAGSVGSFTVSKIGGADMPTTDSDIVFTKSAEITVGGDPAFTAGTMVAAGRGFSQPVKYLRYTAPEGQKVTLGLDESDTPVFRIEELTAQDVTPGPDGDISIQGKVLHMINVHTQNFDGGYGSAGAVRIESQESQQ